MIAEAAPPRLDDDKGPGAAKNDNLRGRWAELGDQWRNLAGEAAISLTEEMRATELIEL